MWIKRSEYDNLIFTANKNKDAANIVQHLISINENGLYFWVTKIQNAGFEKLEANFKLSHYYRSFIRNLW